MGETLLFCVTFLSQALLISWFSARRAIRNRRCVLQNFPPSTHPKLYPQPMEYYERRLRNFARLNLAIVIAALLIIAGVILATFFSQPDWGILAPARNQKWGSIVIVYFLAQIAAMMYLDLSIGHHQAMAKSPPPRVRTTELQRRRLTDFVSPTMLAVAALTNIAFIVFLLYFRRFEFPWFTAAGNIAAISAMLVVLAAGLVVTLRAPKADPYQADRDRRNSIKLVAQQALVVAIASPVLITANLIIKSFDPDFLEPVVASLYCQGVALAIFWPLYNFRPDAIDFDVYKRDARDSTPEAPARAHDMHLPGAPQ